MLSPKNISYYAKKNERKNHRFRTWLKLHADPDELDEKFHRLHHELFSRYDCSKCRNCCKEYYGSIPAGDVERDAAMLDLSVNEFRKMFLQQTMDPMEQSYNTKSIPCDFLQPDGSCILGDNKPDNCKKYPYTDQPDRIGSLLSFLDTVSVCPVAFEILERLKKEYGFDS